MQGIYQTSADEALECLLAKAPTDSLFPACAGDISRLQDDGELLPTATKDSAPSIFISETETRPKENGFMLTSPF